MPSRHPTRRRILIGGGAGIGLALAWAVWPRRYGVNLTAAKGEYVVNGWLKLAEDGHVTVAVPQAEQGQGSLSALAQIVADELGADWRTVAVETAPLNPLYANPLAADELFGQVFGALPGSVREAHAVRAGLMLTAGSSSIRQFEQDCRIAGASARVLLQQAAARRWGVDWRMLGTGGGFVAGTPGKLRFAELAAEAANGGSLPRPLPLRADPQRHMIGRALPRLDSPAKIDGSANYTADIRLPDMVFAAIRQGPIGTVRLLDLKSAAAARLPGIVGVVKGDTWVAAAATSWWTAQKALDALDPLFDVAEPIVSSQSIEDALDDALTADGHRMASAGDVEGTFRGARVLTAEYRVDAALHAALETSAATAAWHDGRLQLWLPTAAPGLTRDAVAAAMGVAPDGVIIFPVLMGGGFGAGLEPDAAIQAAAIARELKRPVQLTWSRGEDCLHDRYRTPAAGRMTARLDGDGRILGWQAKIAAPATGRDLAYRLLRQDWAAARLLALSSGGDAAAVEGAAPVYAIPSFSVDHHLADLNLPTGYWRSAAHSYTCFFTECFLDELAHQAASEPMSYRIAMLNDQPRLVHCLVTATALGGWQGGTDGSGQGLACHSFRGSHIAVMAEAHVAADQSIRVDRLVAAVDCGRVINPDLVKQNIEGGLVFGMAAALGASTGFADGLATNRGFGELKLPRLADCPDITVELIGSDAAPGGVSELAVPPVAPAIANALRAATGLRIRRLPLKPGG